MAKVSLLLIALMSLLAPAAAASEFSILTWERGRLQEVIMRIPSNESSWRLQLSGDGIEPIIFSASNKDKDGYAIFTAQIPATLPIGAYTLETLGMGEGRRILAGVNLIEAQAYDIRKQSQDLTFVVGLFTFITVTLSSLRSRKYSKFKSTANYDLGVGEPRNLGLFKRQWLWVTTLRTRLTQGVNPSLFRYLLGEESAFLSKFSKPVFYTLPLASATVGFFAASNAQSNDGLANSNLFYFFILTVIGLVDSFSGIFGVFAFWLVQFYFGDVASINQLLIIVAAAIAWVGPSLAARLYQDAVQRDFDEVKIPYKPISTQFVAVLGASISASAIFYGGYKLLLSMLGEISKSWQMKPIYLMTIFVVAALKSIFVMKFVDRQKMPKGDEFELVRVASPQISFAVFAITYGFSFSWTANFMNSILAAILFTAPYLLLFIRFESIGAEYFAKFKRNILLEAALAVATSIVIYTQIQRLPQLSNQRVEIYLLAAALPALIHAAYSAICDSAQRKERIKP